MANIIKVSDRAGLKPRHEPYWLKLGTASYLGYRKLTKDSLGTWVAYWRDADSGKKQKHSLGEFADLPASQRYDAATAAADAWLKTRGVTLRIGINTVRDACEDYVKNLRETGRADTASDAEARFKRHVYTKKDLADCGLGKLTAHRLEQWRKGLQKTAVKITRTKAKGVPVVTRTRAASSVNRDCSTLRAALNRAHRLGCVASDVAWLEVLKPTKGADKRRDAYLTRDQRRALIAASAPDLAAFLTGLSLVPLRPGALAGLKVKHYDAGLRVLTIGQDKTGEDRRIKLPETTAKAFAAQVVDKLPAAPLFARADGSEWTRFAWRDALRDAVTTAKVPVTTSAYAMRHSTITDLVTGGLDLMTVAQISGTSVAMIEKHYAHLQSDRAAAALAGLAL